MSKFEYFRELEFRLRGLPERERQNILAVYEELFQKAIENGKSEADIAESLGFPRVPNWDALGGTAGGASRSGAAPGGHAEHGGRMGGYGGPQGGFGSADAREPNGVRPPVDPFREPGSGFTQPPSPPYRDPGFVPPPPPPPLYREPLGSGAKSWIAALALGFFNLVFILGPFLGLCGALIGMWVATGVLILSPLFAIVGTGIPHDSTALLLMAFGSLACFGAGLMMLIILQWATKWFFKLTYKYAQFNWNIIKGA